MSPTEAGSRKFQEEIYRDSTFAPKQISFGKQPPIFAFDKLVGPSSAWLHSQSRLPALQIATGNLHSYAAKGRPKPTGFCRSSPFSLKQSKRPHFTGVILIGWG